MHKSSLSRQQLMTHIVILAQAAVLA